MKSARTLFFLVGFAAVALVHGSGCGPDALGDRSGAERFDAVNADGGADDPDGGLDGGFDGGTDAADGGHVFTYQGGGCACGATDGTAGLAFALLSLRRPRRRSRRR